MDELLIAIDDAIKQATKERSHYYMASILGRVRVELVNYHMLTNLLVEDKMELKKEVSSLTERLAAANIIIENGK
jgi:hypothetical protein